MADLGDFTDQRIKNITGIANPSDYQMAVFRFIIGQLKQPSGTSGVSRMSSRLPTSKGSPKKSLMVEAVAGAGKTTTIVAGSRLVLSTMPSAKVLFLAFNTAIVNELKSRLPEEVEARTLNSAGNAILKRYLMGFGAPPSVERWKVSTIMRNLMTSDDRNNYGEDVRFLVGMCKSLGVVPEGSGLIGIDDQVSDDETLMGILRYYGKYIKAEHRAPTFNFVRQVLSASVRDRSIIDFDDQKYLTVTMRNSQGSVLSAFKYDVVMVDEAQDLNAVDLALLKMMVKPNGMVIGVGDTNQAIYGFRGADVDSIENFKLAFNAESLPLSITYRCARNIVDSAKMIYPIIEAAPNAVDGEVYSYASFNAKLFNAGDLIVCRNNAPLIQFAFRLISNRVPVFVRGRDIGKDLISTIERVSGSPTRGTDRVSFGAKTVVNLAEDLRQWTLTQIEIIRSQNPDDEDSIQRLNDKVDTIKVFIADCVDNRIDSVLSAIRTLFQTDGRDTDDAYQSRGKVVLSTVHKAKGLEAERTFILNETLFHPRWVKKGTWQSTQEDNLQYVARTRAKNLLGFIDIDDFDAGAENVINDPEAYE